MDHKVKERIKELTKTASKHVTTGENRLARQRKSTPPHILEALGSIFAAVAILSHEIEKLNLMHVGLERANLELEELIKTVINQIPQPEDWRSVDHAGMPDGVNEDDPEA